MAFLQAAVVLYHTLRFSETVSFWRKKQNRLVVGK
jgi:hypothetical protein